MENNDKLLEDFFAVNRQEIADNGFTRRVMHRLPDPLAVVLFVVLDGIGLIGSVLRETFAGLLENANQADPKSLVIAGLVLLYFIYRKIASLA